MDTIAVSGLGAVSALGIGAEALWRGLRDSRCGIARCDAPELAVPVMAELPDCNIERHAAELGIAPALAEAALRVARRSGGALSASLLAAAEAWSAAATSAAPDRIALVIAGSNLDQRGVAESLARVAQGRAVRPSYASQFMDTDHVGALSEALGIRGEGYVVGGASASGGVALAHGRRALLSGDVDAVLVVGVPMMLSGVELAALSAVGALYAGGVPEGGAFACRPFDARAEGFVYGQASAAMLLEREAAVRARGRPVLARLAAATMGLDANRSTNPSAIGEAAVMRRALAQAGLQPSAVGLLSAHGTASRLGDRTEAAALLEVFATAGEGPLINAPKALLGHCLASAGVLEAVALVLQMRHGFAHGNPALDEPVEPRLRWVGRVGDTAALACGMSNSFGFGGINSCQIFTRAPPGD